FLGPRDNFPHELSPPHNPGMTMIGAGMLWVGWYGFNGGSALAADGSAGLAITATHLSASTAGIVWALLEWKRFGKPSMIGMGYGVAGDMAGQALIQVIGVGAVIGWSAIATVVIIFITRAVVGLRANPEHVNDGLDLTQHGERAYNP